MLRFLVMMLIIFCSFTKGLAWHDITLTNFTPSDPQVVGEWERLVLPLKRSGNLLLLEGKIDSIQGNFIIDTGAPYLVLNSTYFRNYALGKQTSVTSVSGSVDAAQRGFISQLNFGELQYNAVDADITGLSQLENKLGIRVLGLLGTNLFSQFLLKIDIQKSQLILYRASKGSTIQSSWKDDLALVSTIDTLPSLKVGFKWCDNKIFMPVEVAGEKMNWMFDTGAESNVIDALSKKKILKEFNVTRRVNLTGAGGQKKEVFLGTMSEMSVGEQSFQMQPTIMTGMQEMNEVCSVFVDGILGYSFFSQGVFTIDFTSREFCLYLYKVE
jgi:predicted aspartyl protease